MKHLFLGTILSLFSLTLVAQSKVRYVVANGLNIREQENTTSRVITTLTLGDAVELLGYRSAPTVVNGNKGSWVQVNASGKRGYVFDANLSEVKPTKAPKVALKTSFPTDFKPTRAFYADKADMHEHLKVQNIGNDRIAYEIYMVNGGCEAFTFRGVARLKIGDAESDSDEKNNGYFVNEYVDEQDKTCTILIRIGADKGYTNRARFQMGDCSKLKMCKDKPDSEPLILRK
jgi:uncharacterized protein YgiM (DUF1202 family)